MVVGMSLYSQIREAYISGESQRSIAKRLGVSRPTVKKYCEGAIMPGVRKEYLRTLRTPPRNDSRNDEVRHLDR